MITVLREDYGLRLTFVEPVTHEQAAEWLEEMERAVNGFPDGFSVFVDLRGMELFSSDNKAIVEQVQSICLTHGFKRSVVILGKELTEMQLKLIASASGIRQMERYIVASKCESWEEAGLNWVRHAIEPDVSALPPAS
ncbi:MAG: hypothetical protein ACE5GA_09155 [Candidatus Zixiibacteriota bacterium]